ncbi:MAG TPA: hypothetical protein VLF40_06385 [Candidatus Saccharimonadales bacterium]|nr:hypothetical protein [Candidatus Saccharimonadales bacterium]
MDVKQAIELLLDRMNTRKQFVGGTFGAFEGTAGNLYLQQRDANAAITLWREHRDPGGLMQLAATLHVYGNLKDAEYEQIIDTLDGEK